MLKKIWPGAAQSGVLQTPSEAGETESKSLDRAAGTPKNIAACADRTCGNGRFNCLKKVGLGLNVLFQDLASAVPKLLAAFLMLFAAFSAQADYRDTPQGKLDAARKYADNFLKDDARPGQQFFQREPKFPVWKDQPVLDCSFIAITRAIQSREPYFENRKQTVVVVPVWVELLMLDVGEGAGYPFGKDESGTVQCRFEYEQYSFHSKRFERIPDLLQKPYLQTFKNWGELVPRAEGVRDGFIAIDADKRYVRFKFRVSVVRDAPYQLYPQFPRHHPAMPSVDKLAKTNVDIEDLLKRGVSHIDSSRTGDQLQKDLASLRKQMNDGRWSIEKLRTSLQQLHAIPSFSDLQLQ